MKDKVILPNMAVNLTCTKNYADPVTITLGQDVRVSYTGKISVYELEVGHV